MNPLADESLEAVGDLGVEWVIGLYLADLLKGLVDCLLVLLLSLDPQRNGGHNGIDHIEILEMIGKNLIHLRKNVLHWIRRIYINQTPFEQPLLSRTQECLCFANSQQSYIVNNNNIPKYAMRNFIRHNIDHVKGSRKPVSIERENHKNSHVNKSLAVPRTNINQRISELQKRVGEVENNRQSEIIEQLSSIKEDIRLIKSHIFDRKFQSSEKQFTQESAQDEDNFTSSNKQRMKSQHSQPEKESKVFERSLLANTNKHNLLSEIVQARIKKSHSNYHKNSMNLKTICSMIREYKFEEPEFGTIFYGFSKRNSQAVALKYSVQGLGTVLEIYDRLWKNIAKAKWPCVNRILDFKRQDSSYMIMQRNKGNIIGLPPKPILIDILKILEFIHDCGYLYRNIEPEHFMISEEGQLIVVDFKRAKRYIDIKGHPLEVVDAYTGSPFASNNQLRGLTQSRKDDLESLGYLALLLLELQIPWLGASKEQAVKIKCSLTLQELFKNNIRWVQYMATVMKTPKGERPDYKRLLQILEQS